MFQAIVQFSIRKKLFVALTMLMLLAGGLYSMLTLPIDAVPDITNNQVQIVTVSPTLAPQEVEQLITMPVTDSIEWLETHPLPDLVFLDIHLADGSAFEIFEHTDIPCPIIFTTAYDEYALRAFKVNSIDYLLKPIGEADLRHALDKWARFQ